MATHSHISELLHRWQEARQRGQTVSAEELCREHPQLLEEVRRRIRALELGSRMSYSTAFPDVDSGATPPVQAKDLYAPTLAGDPAPSVPASGRSPSSAAVPRPPSPPAVEHRPDEFFMPRVGADPVPGYRLVEFLGQGGYGEVWKATGPGGFAVAMKFIRLGANAEAVEMRSLELIKEIRHANLLATFGAWKSQGWLIIAMELAERTLMDRYREAVKEGHPGIPFGELLEYMRDAAKGLDYLNEFRHTLDGKEGVGIQHRDIKPQNLLLVGGSVKVADFGLARLIQNNVASHTGSMTPAYAPPEFFRGQTSNQSDQYSLAATYCQLRGGRLPFAGSFEEIVAGHAMNSPDLTMLPEEERAAVKRALAKNPAERWPNCRAFVKSLVENSHTEAAPATGPDAGSGHQAEETSLNEIEEQGPGRPGRWPRWPWLIAASVLTGLLTAGVVFYLKRSGLLNGPGVDGPPVVTIAEVEPAEPFVAGGSLQVHLKGTDPAGHALTYQYRTDPQGTWQSAANGRVSLPNLKPGLLTLEVRVVNDQGKDSPVVSKSWTVHQLGRPPGVKIVRVEPTIPLAGKPLTVYVEGSDPAGRALRYEYRTDPDGGWEQAQANPFVLPALPAGALILQVRARNDLGQTSQPDENKWTVFQPNRPPTFTIVAVEPEEPRAGGSVTILLKGTDPDGDPFRYEYRTDQGDWLPATENRVALPALKPGTLKLEVRAVDSHHEASTAVTRTWTIAKPSISVKIDRTEPAEPVRGEPFTVHLTGTGPDGEPLRYEYRTDPKGDWLPAPKSPLTLTEVSTDPLRLQVRALSQSQVSEPVEHTWYPLGEMRTFRGHTGEVWSVALSPNGREALSGGRDGFLRLWDVDGGQEIPRFQGKLGIIRAIAFSADGGLVLTGGEDRVVRLWVAATGWELQSFRGHTGSVRSVALSANKRQVLSGSNDKTVRLWDVASGLEVKCFDGHTEAVRGVAFSPDGSRVLSHSADGTVRVWDVQKRQELNRLEVAELSSAAFSPDGRRVLTGTKKGQLKLWDLDGKDREPLSFEESTDYVNSVAFSADGRYGLTGSDDHAVCLWDLQNRRLLYRFMSHTDFVYSVVFSADGRFALSGSKDSTVRLWRLPQPAK